MNAEPTAFTNNAEYLESEATWLKVRTQRMQVEDEITRQTEQVVSWPPRRGELGCCELQAKLTSVVETETALRASIDARRNIGGRKGVLLGLDRLQHDHKLNSFERLVLLIAALPALDRQVSDPLEGLDRIGWGHQTSVDVALTVAECSFEERLAYRASFKADAPLIRYGLIKWDACSQPDGPNMLSSSFTIGPQAFSILVGETH